MANQKVIPAIKWEGPAYDVRRVAAYERQAFIDLKKDADDKVKNSRGMLHDKCTALVAEADKPAEEENTSYQ